MGLTQSSESKQAADLSYHPRPRWPASARRRLRGGWRARKRRWCTRWSRARAGAAGGGRDAAALEVSARARGHSESSHTHTTSAHHFPHLPRKSLAPSRFRLSLLLFQPRSLNCVCNVWHEATSDREGSPSARRTVFCEAKESVFELFRRMCRVRLGGGGFFCSGLHFAKACAKGDTPRAHGWFAMGASLYYTCWFEGACVLYVGVVGYAGKVFVRRRDLRKCEEAHMPHAPAP